MKDVQNEVEKDLNIEQNKDEQSQHVEKDETEIISSEIKQSNVSPVSFPRLTQSETSSSPSKQMPDEYFSDEELMDVEPRVDNDVCKALTFLNSPMKFNIPENSDLDTEDVQDSVLLSDSENKENIPNLDSLPNLQSSEDETTTCTEEGTSSKCAEDLKENDSYHELNTTFTIESPEKQVLDPLTALSESLNVTPRLSGTSHVHVDTSMCIIYMYMYVHVGLGSNTFKYKCFSNTFSKYYTYNFKSSNTSADIHIST